jgi:hypothetical protein
MLRRYETVKVLNLTVIKQGITAPVDINLVQTEAIELNQPAVMSVDREGLTNISDDCNEDIFLVAIDYSDVLYLGTQQSSNVQKHKKPLVCLDSDSEFSGDDFCYSRGEYNLEEHNKGVQRDLELIKQIKMAKQIKKEKLEQVRDPKEEAILEALRQEKMARSDPFQQYEGDTDFRNYLKIQKKSTRLRRLKLTILRRSL